MRATPPRTRNLFGFSYTMEQDRMETGAFEAEKTAVLVERDWILAYRLLNSSFTCSKVGVVAKTIGIFAAGFVPKTTDCNDLQPQLRDRMVPMMVK